MPTLLIIFKLSMSLTLNNNALVLLTIHFLSYVGKNFTQKDPSLVSLRNLKMDLHRVLEIEKVDCCLKS